MIDPSANAYGAPPRTEARPTGRRPETPLRRRRIARTRPRRGRRVLALVATSVPADAPRPSAPPPRHPILRRHDKGPRRHVFAGAAPPPERPRRAKPPKVSASVEHFMAANLAVRLIKLALAEAHRGHAARDREGR